MEHETLNDTTIALLGLIITGIAIFIALIFNIKAIRQNSKNQRYQMKKDFYDKFHEIQSIGFDKPEEYALKTTNFAKMIWDLHIDGIVDKNTIAIDLSSVIKETAWIMRNISMPGILTNKQFLKWCDKNKLYTKEPVPERRKGFEKYKIPSKK